MDINSLFEKKIKRERTRGKTNKEGKWGNIEHDFCSLLVKMSYKWEKRK